MATFRAAKTIFDLTSGKISNLPLQKLVYLSHMLLLGRHNRPLASNEFEAWDLGPVEPELYYKLRPYGSSNVEDIFHSTPYTYGDEEYDQISEVLRDFGDATPGKLVGITHADFGAWAKHYKPNIKGIKIPNIDVRQEYVTRAERAKTKI